MKDRFTTPYLYQKQNVMSVSLNSGVPAKCTINKDGPSFSKRMMSDLKVDILPQLWLDCLQLSIFSYLLLFGKLAN